MQAYEIRIAGRLDKRWEDRLGGLQITYDDLDDSVTVLRGTLIDQAALMGVLFTLYNWQYRLISVRTDLI